MPTPLEIANAPGARRGVVVYRPSAQRPAPAPTRRTNGPIRGATRANGPVDWNSLKAQVASSEGAQRKFQEAAEKEAKDQAWDRTPLWGKGLGMVLGNPISKAVLTPLNYMQTLGRGVTLGVEEAAEGLEDAPAWLQSTVGAIPGMSTVLGLVDTERTNADTRSWKDKLFDPNTTYGYGELLDKDNPAWFNNVAGFIGDVGLDPLSYGTFGATRLVGSAAKAAKMTEGTQAALKAEDFASKAAMAAKVGNPDEAARIARLAAEHEAIGRRALAEAETLPNIRTPLRQGRKARESFVGELTETNPQLLVDNAQALKRGAERGFNTVKDPALREALGLRAPSVRFMGAEIPGAGKIAEGLSELGGVARAGMNRTPLLGKAMAAFTPKGLEEASGVLSRGKQGDVLTAATTVRIQNLMRRGAGQMESRGNAELTKLVRSWRKLDADGVRKLFREAEIDEVPNDINGFFKSLTDVYERVSGKKLEHTLKAETYVPHMMTPQFKRFLRDQVADAKTTKDMGFATDDLLEGSQYIEKSRKLKPETVGTPKDFKIGDRTITLTDGTVEELNDELAAAFPEFKGKAYMDDPVRIGEAYISSIARQAGRDFALDRMAKSENPLVRSVTGDLLEAVEKRNAFLRHNPIIEKVKAGYTKGQRLVPAVPKKGDIPTTPFDDMFATTLHRKETQANRDLLYKEGKQFISVVGKDVSESRQTLAENLKSLRTTLKEGLKKKEQRASNQLKLINSTLDKVDDEIKKLGPLTTANVDEMVGMQTTINAQIKDVKAEIKKIRDRYGKKGPRDTQRIQRELEKVLRRLEDDADKVRKQYAKGSYEMRVEAKARLEALEQPIRDAEQLLEQAKAKAAGGPPPVAADRVQEANSYLATQFESDEAYDAQYQIYTQALNQMREQGIPIRRRTNGQLTTETTDMAQQVAAEIRKAQAPTPTQAAAAASTPAAAAPPPTVIGPEAVAPEALVPPGPEPVVAAPAAPEAPAAAGIGFPTAAGEDRLQQLTEIKQGLENSYRDAVADNDENLAAEIEDQLDELQEQIDATGAGGAPGPPPAAQPPAPLVKQADGGYVAEDGWSIEKHGSRWHVVLGGEDRSFGSFKTMKEAVAEIEMQRDVLAAPVGTEAVAAAPSVAPATPAAVVPEPVAAAERRRIGGISKKNKLTDGSNTYSVSDGVDYYTIRKNDDGQWIVRTNNEVAQADNGYRSLQKAGEAIDSGKHRAAAAPEPTAAAVEPPAPATPVPEPVAAASTPKPKGKTPRAPKGWKKQDDIHIGPDGWTVEPYQQSPGITPEYLREGYVDRQRGMQGPLLPGFAVEGEEAVGPTRYLALHPSDDGLRGVSYASATEAKLAVQDLQRRRLYHQSLDEYVARGQGRFGVVDPTRAYEYTGGVRTIEEPTPPPPDVAAANVAASANAPRLQRPEHYVAPEWETTPEGAAALAQRPTGTGRAARGAYDDAFDAWKEMERQAIDPSLTEAQRNKAKRTARSMGGEFTTKGGKFHQRYAAEQVVFNNAEYERKLLASKEVQDAIAGVEEAKAAADRQVEAMVYTKHHNPVTGTDEFRRLPAGSMTGFGEDVERKFQPIEVPEQGEAPTGTRQVPDEPVWESTYTQAQRDADRAAIEAGSPIMPHERQVEYDEMTLQAQDIKTKLDSAAANEDELRRLDEVAKAAYTTEVKAADEAVAEAQRLQAKAQLDASERNIAGAAMRFEEAKRHTKQVIAEQTEARQAWMEADRAWKRALDERQEYLDAQAKVSRLEKAIFESAQGEAGTKVVDELRAGRLPKMGKLSKRTQGFAQELQMAMIELDELDRAGRTFLTPTQARDLAGNLVAIDESKRKLLNRLQKGAVTPITSILPRPDMRAPSVELMGKGPDVPMVQGTGQEDLAARAYAESLNPTEPRERTIWGVDEEGAPVARREVSGRQAYEPGTEREAITNLELEADRLEAGKENAPMRREIEQIKQNMGHEERTAEYNQAATALLNESQKNAELLPQTQKLETLVSVNEALHNKEKLVPQRVQAEADYKKIIATKPTGKQADLVRATDEIGQVARQNPDLLDDDLAVTEALLHDSSEEAKRLVDNDLTTGQVQKAIDKISDPKDHSLDVMLTTVGKTWGMIYEANGAKKAVLSKGDIVLRADLHKQFNNLYEISKDRVLLGRTVNALTNLFKTYATLTPGFHIRNALSAVFMNATDGVPLRSQLKGAQLWREYMEGGEEWLGKQPPKIRDAFAAAQTSGAGGRFSEAGFAEAMESGRWIDWLERAQRNKVTRWSQRVGQRVEGSVRLGMALHSMDLGEEVEAAVQRINRIHFDYGEISKLDENAKRLIPFWTFMSRNMPMQVSQMWTHPNVYLRYERFVNNFSGENEENTPAYWTKAGAWNTGVKMPGFIPERFGGGLPIYMSPDLGYTRLAADLKDYEDFLSWERPGAVLSQGNPIGTTAVEMATRQDIFTGRKFEEGETVPMGGLFGLPIKAAAMLTGQYKDGEVDASFANAMRGINPLQDRSVRLLPQLAGKDPEGEKRQIESWLRTMGGVPIRTLTPKQQDSEMLRRKYEELDARTQSRARERRKAG